MTTLKDISRRSGYSVTTVSRALNGFPDVTEQTRRRIEAVAREMNYRPNQVARKLVSGRSGMVGLVLAAPPSAFEYGHFFEVIAGLSAAFSARDMDFVLHVGSGGDVLTTYNRLINRGTLDGFIVTAPEVEDARIELLLERDVAFVVHGHQPATTAMPISTSTTTRSRGGRSTFSRAAGIAGSRSSTAPSGGPMPRSGCAATATR